MSLNSLREQLLKWREKNVAPPQNNSSQISSRKVSPKIIPPLTSHNPIHDTVKKKGIEALYHFTPAVNLGGILDKGILPRSQLVAGPNGTAPVFSDAEWGKSFEFIKKWNRPSS